MDTRTNSAWTLTALQTLIGRCCPLWGLMDTDIGFQLKAPLSAHEAVQARGLTAPSRRLKPC